MKKLLVLLASAFAMTVMLTMAVSAADGKCGDNVSYTYNTDEMGGISLVISGTGDMYNYDDEDNPAPWYDDNGDIYEVIVEEGVTSVGDYAFASCRYLGDDGEVSLPSSLKRIGANAFSGCSQRVRTMSLVLPANVEEIGEYAFTGMNTLNSITLPANLKTLGEGVFNRCVKLSSIDLPANCTDIKAGAFLGAKFETIALPANMTVVPAGMFEGCTAIKTVIFNDKLEEIGKDAFKGITTIQGDIVVPDTVKKISKSAFESCKGITSVTVPELCEIGDYAFKNCINVTKVSMSENCGNIGMHAFTGCVGLAEVEFRAADAIEGNKAMGANAFNSCIKLTTFTVPTAITTIGDRAFGFCTTLNNIDIHAGVTSIGAYAFRNCKALKSVELPADLKSIGAYAMEYSGITSFTFPETITVVPAGMFIGCADLENVKLASGTTSVKEYAFNGCTALKSVDLPASVNEIKYYAFKDTGLTSVTIPEGVDKIENGMFFGSADLASVTIPSTVKYIGTDAFNGCKALANAELPAGLVGISKNAFYGTESLADVIIPKSVQYIQAYAYCKSGAKNLVVLSANTSVGQYAFGAYRSGTEDVVVEGATVYAPDTKVSLAKQYAEKNGVAFAKVDSFTGDVTKYQNDVEAVAVVKGDADGDGVVTITDVLFVKKAIANSTYIAAADVDGNGILNAIDILLIKRAVCA